ncbi:unnamed protein product (macronuclear) [Paramecium tetraurelia]|uniref:Uncharacterized protein n=1 Tax=Paramecium tetraurelia TaxID=5888 RepID=A0BZI8_PARTE|nr:uncharacterized protein GSPATT00033808001 [Paramecium tetraurelia]CAK63955.1 unnamed protein product [Paramecium tetraurelia]|eukprot:XP_001431353.1 hypothetical protein (macronuclear) [Paramecium tetraurelia strain d4-2]
MLYPNYKFYQYAACQRQIFIILMLPIPELYQQLRSRARIVFLFLPVIKWMIVIKSLSNKMDLLVVIPEQLRKSTQLIRKLLEIQNQQSMQKPDYYACLQTKTSVSKCLMNLVFHLFVI